MTDLALAGRVAASERSPQPSAKNNPAVPKRHLCIASRRESGRLPRFAIMRAESRFNSRSVELSFEFIFALSIQWRYRNSTLFINAHVRSTAASRDRVFPD